MGIQESRTRIAIVAALEREIRPLVRRWSAREREYAGRRFRFFEENDAVAVCGGIGAEAGRWAAEAVIVLYDPKVITSVGFAGALSSKLKVGDVVQPERIVNAQDGSCVGVDGGSQVLVSFGSVASPEQKTKLRNSYGADAVDMEAAAVARAAELRGVAFQAVKVISDDAGFIFPAMEKFVDPQGRFLEWKFGVFAGVRPWLWPQVARLIRNSNLAAGVLCEHLRVSLMSASDGRDLQMVDNS